MKAFLAVALALAGIYAPVSISNETARPLTVRVATPGAFEVVLHRVAPAGVGAAVGGLIGAAIQGGMQASDDSAKTSLVLQRLSDPSCSAPLLQAMTELLQKEGRLVLQSGNAGDATAAVVLHIRECGLRVAESTSGELSAFVNFELNYTPAGKTGGWSEKIQVSGRNRHNFSAFSEQDGLAQSELKDVLQRAGKRAAHKIIYQREGAT